MKKNVFIVSLFFLFLFVVSPFLAKGTTETVLEQYDLTFEWGYVYYFSERTPEPNTEVSLDISSSEPLTFFVCDEGDAEKYANGEEIYAYYIRYDVLSTKLTFTLDDKRSYDFSFDNMNSDGLDAYIYHVIITFTYEASSNWFVWVIIGAAVVGLVIILARRRSKPTSPGTYAQPPQYSSYETQQPNQQQSYTQPVTPPKYCTNCGATNEDNAMFCTNCGAKLA